MFQHQQSTSRIQAESIASAAALATALDLVDEGVLLLETDLVVRMANTRAAELLGSTELTGSSLVGLLSTASGMRLRASAHAVRATTATRVGLAVETAAETTRRLDLTLHELPDDESAGFIAILRPAATSEVASRSAERDYLTGLPLRAALAARLQAAEFRAQRTRNQYAVLFLDVDAFKRLNDARGHITADRVLATVAERLQAAVRPGDLVVRYGGDEFVIVVDDISPPQLARLARRLRTKLAAPVEIAGQWIAISASIGRALGDASRSAALVLEEADRAMYRAKAARRRKRPR